MIIGFNFKLPAILATNKRSNLCFDTLKSGTDVSSLAIKVIDGTFFQYKAIPSTLKICCLV